MRNVFGLWQERDEAFNPEFPPINCDKGMHKRVQAFLNIGG